MDALALRRIIAHWIADLDLARLRGELSAFLRAGKRRAQERKIAELEAWKALVCISDVSIESGDIDDRTTVPPASGGAR